MAASSTNDQTNSFELPPSLHDILRLADQTEHENNFPDRPANGLNGLLYDTARVLEQRDVRSELGIVSRPEPDRANCGAERGTKTR
jgi:hypothetical protein